MSKKKHELTPEEHAKFSKVGRSNVQRSKSHERQVANWLTEWSGVQFRRRRAEGRGECVIEVEGAADVIAVGADCRFSIEAKCGDGFNLDTMFSSPLTTKFTQWWHQATYDAQLMTKSRGQVIDPMLFFRPVHNANWVAFPVQCLLTLGQTKLPYLTFYGYRTAGMISGNVSHSKKHKELVELFLDDVVMCRWHDFAVHVRPSFMLFDNPPSKILQEDLPNVCVHQISKPTPDSEVQLTTAVDCPTGN